MLCCEERWLRDRRDGNQQALHCHHKPRGNNLWVPMGWNAELDRNATGKYMKEERTKGRSPRDEGDQANVMTRHANGRGSEGGSCRRRSTLAG